MAEQSTPAQRAASAAEEMDAAGEKVTVSAVRARAGVSMEAARLGVEQWRAQARQAEVPIPEAVQRAFAGAWAAAAAEAAARYQADREAAGQLVEAAKVEARDAGDLVDAEAARADAEAQRADKAEEQVAHLTERLAALTAQTEGQRRDAASALEAERAAAAAAREELAEMRGRLAVLQEQAETYWNKDDTDR
ncbi:hypothetical protein [Arthrobacter sp. KK5.5]|uniref:hypothetical protein n=1 Tax=Arthrobacter sp. KK5.5 TaxID=3373084 RepID=UPI003EE4DE34